MAWTTPPTFTSDAVLLASELNAISADLAYLKGGSDGVAFSGCKLSRSTDLATSDTAYTDVTMTAEAFDVGGWWSSGASATVPASAVPSGYTTVALLVIAVVRWDANGTGTRGVAVSQNGSDVDYLNTSGLSGETTTVSYSTVLQAAAGDTVKLRAYQSSGGSLDVNLAKMTVVRLAPIS